MKDNKTFVIERLVPALHEVLRKRNKEAFTKWQGNCCMQTAMIVATFMKVNDPHQDWDVYEGVWRGKVGGVERVFNHGWVYGTPRKGFVGVGTFIDAAHRKSHRLWVENTPNRRPAEFCGDRWREEARWGFDLNKSMSQHEFFTGLTGFDLFFEVLKLALDETIPLTEDFLESIRPPMCDG